MTGADFKNLETRGFVVIPSFLSEGEVQEFRDDFNESSVDAVNRNYRLKQASPQTNAHLEERVQVVLRMIAEHSDLHADLPQGAHYFATGKSTGVNFPWHQDHESFFQVQNHYDYLNFYIPVTKPRPDKSNLSVVPFDLLERESPKTFAKMVRSGASQFVRIGTTELAICDDSGTVHVMNGDLERVAHTPELAPGDLLVLRGDVIHRTQDAETERIAVSFRVASAQTVVRRSRLAEGGLSKAEIMANNPGPYQRMFMAFDLAGRDEMPLRELMGVMANITAKPIEGRLQFFKLLLNEKRRAGVMSRFTRSLVVMGAVSAARRALKPNNGTRQGRAPVRPAEQV